MDTRKMLAKAIEQHPELLPFSLDEWPKGLQEQFQTKVKWPMRSQGISTHVCCPYVGQHLEYFWEFVKKELDYGIANLLPNNSISITQLWLRFLMLANYKKRWSWKMNSWRKIKDYEERRITWP